MGAVTRQNNSSNSAHRGRPGYSRDDVIRAAVREFNSRGYDATSMGHVADVLGISKSALYHHISSKEEILAETVSRALDELERGVERATDDSLEPGEAVRYLIQGSVEVLCSDPESVALLLRLRGNSEAEEKALERRRALTRSVVPLIDAAQRAGKIRDDVEPAVLARMVFGMVNSIAEWYRPGGKLEGEKIADMAVSVLFYGLTSTSS